MNTREALGIDVGGVIIARLGLDEDTTFVGANYLSSPGVPGAFEVIQQLVDVRFGSRVFVVSKAGPRARAKTLRWLKNYRFFETTGVKPKHVQFCLERGQKETICRKLGITHFVDDRLDVLLSLKSVPHRFLFDSSARFHGLARSSTIRRVQTWTEIAEALLPRSRGEVQGEQGE